MNLIEKEKGDNIEHLVKYFFLNFFLTDLKTIFIFCKPQKIND